jgi:hypothetical protein
MKEKIDTRKLKRNSGNYENVVPDFVGHFDKTSKLSVTKKGAKLKPSSMKEVEDFNRTSVKRLSQKQCQELWRKLSADKRRTQTSIFNVLV